ncbi:MAG TPA: hypothetical protein VH000_03960 [Rhizomicrobium sp.]|jgi:hypothetical protein|nr:hypothetical protein [Rhizomicrobium sp.]
MTRIYMPSSGPDAWKQFLADPEKHWRTGYSAKTLAHCWEAADGLPPEISNLFQASAEFTGAAPKLLFATPEHKVPLPGGQRDSQTDIFCIIRAGDKTVATAIEGKVAETFGPTVGEWSAGMSDGKRQRLAFLCELLGMKNPPPADIRYQLLHRTASAILEAQAFKTDAAAMIVHSFSPEKAWFAEYSAFARLLGGAAGEGELTKIALPTGVPLYLGWAVGAAEFLQR